VLVGKADRTRAHCAQGRPPAVDGSVRVQLACQQDVDVMRLV